MRRSKDKLTKCDRCGVDYTTDAKLLKFCRDMQDQQRKKGIEVTPLVCDECAKAMVESGDNIGLVELEP